MLKRSFFGLVKPTVRYEPASHITPKPVLAPLPKRATLFYDAPYLFEDSLLVKRGDVVKTGQRVAVYEGKRPMVSPVTGVVADISGYTGDFGRRYTAISIDTEQEAALDEGFADLSQAPDLKMLEDYFSGAPGRPDIDFFSDPELSIDTILISGVDADLLLRTSAHVVATEFDAIQNGIHILKKVTGVEKVVMAVHRDGMQGFGHLDAECKPVDRVYPAGNPILLIRSCLGRMVPAGKTPQEVGICVMSVEAVASIGRAFMEKRIPVDKLITVVPKNGQAQLVKARIGTPVGDLLKLLGIEVQEMDRLILGGPMTGSTIYSTSHPVEADTDGILIQDKGQVTFSSDYPCINCGDCVRICPANIQVSMLVRLLEFGAYEQAADEYDLNSCIECGLCSFVCVSRIPIFQYIKLAKHELARMRQAEGADA